MTEAPLLFREDTGDVFTLNATGAYVYRLHRAGVAASRIAARLAARHRIPRRQALDDVHVFLADLRMHGLLDRR